MFCDWHFNGDGCRRVKFSNPPGKGGSIGGILLITPLCSARLLSLPIRSVRFTLQFRQIERYLSYKDTLALIPFPRPVELKNRILLSCVCSCPAGERHISGAQEHQRVDPNTPGAEEFAVTKRDVIVLAHGLSALGALVVPTGNEDRFGIGGFRVLHVAWDRGNRLFRMNFAPHSVEHVDYR